jgi:sugar/nucleoside kinase (ribokinase family)
VIVVIGSPLARPAEPDRRGSAAGQAVEVGRGAVEGGSVVQLVGKIGDDPAGDALVVAIAEAGIGHAAILRDPARPTQVMVPAGHPDDDPFASDAPSDAAVEPAVAGSVLDPEDLELALRYLPDHRVVVVAEQLGAAALASVVSDCSYVGAELVLIIGPGATGGLPAGAIVLEAPEEDPDGVFGRTVGLFAAALDQGRPAAEALAAATSGTGWTAVAG